MTEWGRGDILRLDNINYQYEIIADPIEGGMGVIYICKTLNHNEFLAFKGLNNNVIDSPEAKIMLEREAELWRPPQRAN